MRSCKADSAAPIVVTTENFGNLLVQGAREALAIARGELASARVRVVTVRDTVAPPSDEAPA